jgi:RHS repeat-associated protein
VRRVFASPTSAPAYGYDPYGLPLQVTAPLTDFIYGGMFYNADSGLYLATYRPYDPVAGRWLSRDPLGEEADSAANLYAYVGGEPISLVDPHGENALLAIAGAAAFSAAVDVGAQLISNGGNFGCIDWGSVGMSAGLGASLSSGIIAANFIRAALSRAARQSLIAGTPTGLGAVLPTPQVASRKLQNIVNDLYKGTTNPRRVGTGTTADAVRRELATGKPVGGRFHSQKATDSSRGLQKWLTNNPGASYRDRVVAQSLLDDLLSALGGR